MEKGLLHAHVLKAKLPLAATTVKLFKLPLSVGCMLIAEMTLWSVKKEAVKMHVAIKIVAPMQFVLHRIIKLIANVFLGILEIPILPAILLFQALKPSRLDVQMMMIVQTTMHVIIGELV